jgi:hypothetical protein
MESLLLFSYQCVFAVGRLGDKVLLLYCLMYTNYTPHTRDLGHAESQIRICMPPVNLRGEHGV